MNGVLDSQTQFKTVFKYSKVLKVMTFVTFGFSSLFLSLLSEGCLFWGSRYYWVTKLCTVHGLLKDYNYCDKYENNHTDLILSRITIFRLTVNFLS